jgi:hypothetical protein
MLLFDILRLDLLLSNSLFDKILLYSALRLMLTELTKFYHCSTLTSIVIVLINVLIVNRSYYL